MFPELPSAHWRRKLWSRHVPVLAGGMFRADGEGQIRVRLSLQGGRDGARYRERLGHERSQGKSGQLVLAEKLVL
jgi:hypothetical protein